MDAMRYRSLLRAISLIKLRPMRKEFFGSNL